MVDYQQITEMSPKKLIFKIVDYQLLTEVW
jgi:hypothetical protein